MRELTQDEYLERCVNPKKIEDTLGWGLKFLYGNYSLYRAGVGVSEEYKIFESDIPYLPEAHYKARDRMLKKLSILILDYLYRNKIISKPMFIDLTQQVNFMTVCGEVPK